MEACNDAMKLIAQSLEILKKICIGHDEFGQDIELESAIKVLEQAVDKLAKCSTSNN